MKNIKMIGKDVTGPSCALCAFAVNILVLTAVLPAQEDFGFGFGDPAEEAPAASGSMAQPSPVSIGGEAQARLVWYPGEEFSVQEPWSIFAGKINFKAAASNAEAVINLKLKPDFAAPASIVSFDEAYLRAYFGAFDLEAGLRKLTWGKADSFGPLDVINPVDYTDLTSITDVMGSKISRPLVHVSYRAGSFSKVEAVFVPWFEGHRFAQSGRWTPAQLSGASILDGILDKTNALMRSQAEEELGRLAGGMAFEPPATAALEYAQGGVRFTATIGPADLGVQYYSGYLFRPAVFLPGLDKYAKAGDDMVAAVLGGLITPEQARQEFAEQAGILLAPKIGYNRFHQIGADYAQVAGGFNLRAELAAMITSDLSGDDGGVYNPSIGWSLGFDRDAVLGINLNVQGTGSIRLLHDRISGNSAADTEGGSSLSSTRLTLVLSKKFLRDELELKAAALWGIEDMDCYIMPAVVWTKGDLAVELAGGIFAGSEDGELGQYRSNGFIKTAITYSF